MARWVWFARDDAALRAGVPTRRSGAACHGWLLPALLVMAGGCGAARVDVLEGEVHKQREELAELRRNQAAQRVLFDEFRNRLVVLQDRLETEALARDRAARARGHEPVPILPRVEVAPGNPMERQEPTQPGGLPSQPRSVVIGPDGVPREAATAPPATRPSLPRAGVAGRATARPAAEATAPAPQEGSVADDAAAAEYSRAKALLDAGDLEGARRGFQTFLEERPDHALSDNALYWIGETWYAKALWIKAAKAFGDVVSRYPQANKVPDAMLKLGFCYERLGERALAQAAWSQLLRAYPRTPAGEQARERLGQGASK